MKKIIISITLVLVNIIGIYYWIYYFPSQDIYSEEVIKKTAVKLDGSINLLINNIETEIQKIQEDHHSVLMSPEKCNHYFLETLDKQRIIKALLFFKNNKKFIIQREQNSVISACDSAAVINIVKWSRFQKGKKISEWNEVFDKKNFNTEWINRLNLRPNEFQWVRHYLPLEAKATLLLGKSWIYKGNQFSLAIRFCKEEIRKSFKAIEHFKKFSAIFQTSDGKMLNLASNAEFETDSTLLDEDFIKSINKGVKQLDDKDNVFSYIFEGQLYWATVKKMNSRLGIQRLIISIPDQSIHLHAKKTKNYGYLYYILLALISGAILVITFKKSISIPQFRIGKRKNISIENLLQDNESRHLEFKSSLRWDYRQEKVNPDLELVILKTIAAFGNSDGGILLIGVDDEKNILGIENDLNTLKKKDSDFYEIYMRNLFHKYFGVKYTTENIRMDFIKDGHKEVCLIEIFKADEPLYLKTKDKNGQMSEKFYVRSGNSSQKIDSLKDINDYIFDRFKATSTK